MIYVQPGATFTAVIEGFAAGLTGTLGVRIENPDGTTHTARVTTGIVEVQALSGVYTKADLVAPTVAGAYVVLWDDGSLFKSELLTVTSSSGTVTSPSGSDLTTLASVRAFMQKLPDDDEQDPLISGMIPAASLAIMQWAGREFAPATATATRTFSYDGSGLLNLVPYDLRSASAILSDPDGVATALTTPTDYQLRPRNAPDGVYTHLLLPTRWSPLFATSSDIAITGAWGFASVPADVTHWCNVTIKWWIENDVSAFSSGFDANTDQFTRGQALPEGVRRGLAPYRRVALV